MKRAALLFIITALCVATVDAQKVDRSKFLRDSLQLYINRALTNWRVPGAAVAIIKDNKVVWLKGYGVKELGLNDKVDENTLFMIGSNTKAFTATTLAMLQTEHKLSIDDKITKYIPTFRLDDKAAGEMTTIRDLLCHRIGFQTFQGDFTFWNTDLTRDQIIAKMALVKAVYPFRSKWGYTNSAFLTAGQMVQAVTGKSWEAYIKDYIFAPLGMGNTLALSKPLPTAFNKTVPHTIVDGRLTAIPYEMIDGMAPAASISSTANDMSKWVLCLLNGGRVGKRQVIPEAAINATREPQDIVKSVKYLNGEEDYQLYGLGWDLQNYQGRNIVWHSGATGGYLSSVTLVPKENLGIIILTNTDQNRLFDALRWEIIDAYFGLPYRNYSDTFLATYKANESKAQELDHKTRDTVALLNKPAQPLANYAGKYINDLYGTATITTGENNDLEMRFEHHPKMYAHLQALGGNRFYATFSNPEMGKAVFPFTVQNGVIKSVRVKVDDELEQTPYEFRKVQ